MDAVETGRRNCLAILAGVGGSAWRRRPGSSRKACRGRLWFVQRRGGLGLLFRGVICGASSIGAVNRPISKATFERARQTRKSRPSPSRPSGASIVARPLGGLYRVPAWWPRLPDAQRHQTSHARRGTGAKNPGFSPSPNRAGTALPSCSPVSAPPSPMASIHKPDAPTSSPGYPT